MGIHAGKEQRGKLAGGTDDAWERLVKIREKLSKAATDDEVTERLAKLGAEIGKVRKRPWKYFPRCGDKKSRNGHAIACSF